MDRLTPEFLKCVGDYMLVETPLKHADVCILFGNRQHPDILANHAADLYAKGCFDRIVVSGGVKTDDGRLEAHRMRDVLVERGVPESAILVEDKATNSEMNVLNSMALLEKSGGLAGVSSVMAVGAVHASRRFLMTLERRWPGPLKMFTAPNHFAVSRKDWDKDRAFRAAVLGEYAKIAPYKARGFLSEVDMESLNARIAALPPAVCCAAAPAP